MTLEEIAKISGVPDAVTIWHGPNTWSHTCPLGDDKLKITTNVCESAWEKEKDIWG